MKYSDKANFETGSRLNKINSVIIEDNNRLSPLLHNNLEDQHVCILRFSNRQKITIQNKDQNTSTLINGIPLQQTTQLNNKDIISLNSATLELTCSEIEEKPAASASPSVSLHSNNKEGFSNKKIYFAHKFDLSRGPITDLSSSNYSSEKLTEIINSICTFLNMINSANEKSLIVDKTLHEILKIAQFSKVSIILTNIHNNVLEPLGCHYAEENTLQAVFTVNADIVRHVLKTSEAVIIENSQTLDINDYAEKKGSTKIFCVPLTGKHNISGVIYGESESIFQLETDRDTLALITAIGQQIGIAMERSRQDQGLKKMFLGSMLALTASIEAKDKYTKGHSERVTCYALMLADELKLPESKRIIVELAGLLHDIGKIGVPETVLCSPDKLSGEEFEYMKQHPQIGADIVIKMPDLKGIASVSSVASAIKHHHEKFDGSGYPSGISGNKIPVSSRILAIADTFDAITSNRTYRLGQSAAKAIEILEETAGQQVDPKLFNIFKTIYKRGDLAYPERVRTMIDFDIEILKESTVISN